MGFTVIALTPDPSAALIDSVGQSRPRRPAAGLGSGRALEAALAAADLHVRIGQTGALDSLNVGHAAAIAFHHFRKEIG